MSVIYFLWGQLFYLGLHFLPFSWKPATNVINYLWIGLVSFFCHLKPLPGALCFFSGEIVRRWMIRDIYCPCWHQSNQKKTLANKSIWPSMIFVLYLFLLKLVCIQRIDCIECARKRYKDNLLQILQIRCRYGICLIFVWYLFALLSILFCIDCIHCSRKR